MTTIKMASKAALTYAPKIYARKNNLNKAECISVGEKIKKLVDNDTKSLANLNDAFNEKFGQDANAVEIFNIAKALEGTITGFGQHAAGVIAVPSADIEDFIPLMTPTKDKADDTNDNKMSIQADMVAAEAYLGFIKFDFLGLKNLNVLAACQDKIQQRYGKFVDLYSLVPNDPEVYKKIFQSGFTDFVFQVESAGMRGMLKELKPEKFGDIVLAISCYRPGPMDFIPDIIASKNEGKISPFVEKFSILKPVLDETYGYPVYQEQVMKIMTVCAGFDLGHADNVRRFMSKKKEEKLAAEKPAFIEGCVKNGIDANDADWLFEQLMPFAKYGFNKSHAAAYALVTYMTAWAKLYYPEEYLTSVMLEQGDKTMQFLSNCEHYGIEVLPVSINQSLVDYSVEAKGKVRIGLSAIKGLSASATKIVENRGDGYVSFKDFVERSGLDKKGFDCCILSGACDEFVKNRNIALEFRNDYTTKLNELAGERTSLEKSQAKLETVTKEKDIEKVNDDIKVIETNINEIKAQLEEMNLDMVTPYELTNKEKCTYELQYLGMYLNGKSPLDDFDTSAYADIDLEKLAVGTSIKTLGIVYNFKEITTKKKGEKMAFFNVVDKDSNDLKCVAFANTYKKLDFDLEDGAIVEIVGNIDIKNSDNDNDEEEKQIILNQVKLAYKGHELLTIDAQKPEVLQFLAEKLPKYRVLNGGVTVAFSNFMGNNTRECAFKVSEEIVNELKTNKVDYYII